MPFTPSPSLLVTSNALEENLFDKITGLPLSNGVVTFYQDNNRTTLKNIYQQTGVFGAYTYTALPNPMTLNADGTTSDGSGNNVKIFYYPFDESNPVQTAQAYFITVYNSAGQFQFSRANFPFEQPVITPIATVATLENYIINNRFWRNVGAGVSVSSPANTISINGLNAYYTTLAPSQHDSFSMPDIIFIKNSTADSSNDQITFGLFAQAPVSPVLTGDVTPEFYVEFLCTATGSDTYKYIQIPISLHLLTLGGQPNCTVTFQAQVVSGNANLGIQIFPFAGTGATSPAPVFEKNFSLGSSWTKYSVTFTMPPSITEASLGVGGDDAFYLQLVLPAGGAGITRMQIALPSFFVSATVPTNDFSTYDQVDAIINSPRTGDIRTSMNSFSPFGWVTMNSGSIGSSASAATNRAAADTWPLYNLLWNNVNNAFAPVSTGRGANAYADFSANKTLGLTTTLGKVLLGYPTGLSCNYSHAATPTWHQGNYIDGGSSGAAVAGVFTLIGGTSIINLYPGAPVILGGSLPTDGPFTAGVVYYAVPDPTNRLTSGPGANTPGTTFQLAATYNDAILLNPLGTSGNNDGSVMTLTFALGGSVGEATHLPQIAELVSHSHSSGNGEAFLTSTGTTVARGGSTMNVDTVNMTGTTGNTNFYNNVQPGLYVNIFIKL